MQDKVSVIITTHNRLSLLKRAIESVQNQTYNNIECIVVNDASSDGTEDYCKSLPIVTVTIEKSRGGNYARNMGVKVSKGMYLAFLDDDDYWMPTKIEKQLNLIKEKGCEMVHCGRTNEIVTPSGIKYKEVLPSEAKQGDLSQRIFTDICTTTTCMFVKKQAIIDIGMFDEKLRFWQEYDLTIRLAQRAPIYFVAEALCVYRIDKSDPNRLTNKYTEWLIAVDYIHKKYAVYYKQLGFWNTLKAKLLVARDAAVRCKGAGFKLKYYYFGFYYVIGRLLLKITNK